MNRRFMLWFVIFAIDGVSFRKHPLVQDAGDHNTPTLLAVENGMPTMFHVTQTGADIITGPA